MDQLQPDENYAVDNYAEAYFSDKVLLVLYVTLESGSTRLQIDNAITSGNMLTIQYTTTRPKEFTNDMAYWQVLLEVNKSDVEGISLITGERNKVFE